MSKNVIFCYSGTGNCLDMAKNIARELGDTDIILMRARPAVTDVREAKAVGFIFPCYAGGLPEGVEESVRAVELSPHAYAFAVCQYAGYMGCGLNKIDSIIHLNYWKAVSHQCSCIWLLPHQLMLPPMSPEKAQRRSEAQAKKIAKEVYYRRYRDTAPPKMRLNELESRAWPQLSALKAKKLTATEACVGCGQCAKLCPKGNIRLENGKPVFGTSCIGCLSCLQYCPQEAITLGRITARRGHYHNPHVTPEELMRDVIHFD